MNRLKKDQKEKVNEFKTFAGGGISNAKAIEFLKAENWNLEQAMNRFFNADAADIAVGEVHTAPASGSAIDKLFARYQSEEDPDVMDIEGVMKFMEDLSMDQDDNALIAFAFLCEAQNFSEFKREQFATGCSSLGVATVSGLKAKLPQLRKMVDDVANFDAIYNFVFLWACNPGKKLMDLDGACNMWRRLLTGKHAWKHTEAWCSFLQEHHKRPMNQDTWRLALPFMRANSTTFDDFDDSQAWPVLIDEFVEHMQKT